MKKLLLVVALALGVIPTAYATEISIEPGVKISAPDNNFMSIGVGGQIGVFAQVKDVEKLEAGARFGMVSYDVESPFSNAQIGDNQQATLDLLLRYKGLPAYKKIQPYALVGVGFTVSNDLESDIAGLNLSANKAARLLGGLGVEWLAVEAKPVAEQKKPIDSISVRLFADASVISSDAKWEINGVGVDVDNDSFDVSTGFVFAKAF